MGSQRREITLMPDEGRSAASASEDARSGRFLLGVTLATGTTLGLMGVVLLQLIVALVNERRAPMEVVERGGGAMCKEGSSHDCDVGEVCRSGRCVKARQAKKCQVGDPCGGEDGCTCAAPLRCEDNVCQAPAKVAAACDDEAVQRVLRGIAETCKNDLDSCPDQKLEEFAIESKDFDTVLAKFPNTLTVHFPDNQPSTQRGQGPWPVDPERAYYRAQLGQPYVAAALKEAEEIIVVGRSSEGGLETENYKYSQRRTDVVVDLLVANVTRQSEQKALRGKIKRLLLGSRKTLDLDFFNRNYANRMIAWSPEEEETLRANVADAANLRGNERRKTVRLINQVAFVVPLPCKLPEAD